MIIEFNGELDDLPEIFTVRYHDTSQQVSRITEVIHIDNGRYAMPKLVQGAFLHDGSGVSILSGPLPGTYIQTASPHALISAEGIRIESPVPWIQMASQPFSRVRVTVHDSMGIIDAWALSTDGAGALVTSVGEQSLSVLVEVNPRNGVRVLTRAQREEMEGALAKIGQKLGDFDKTGITPAGALGDLALTAAEIGSIGLTPDNAADAALGLIDLISEFWPPSKAAKRGAGTTRKVVDGMTDAGVRAAHRRLRFMVFQMSRNGIGKDQISEFVTGFKRSVDAADVRELPKWNRFFLAIDGVPEISDVVTATRDGKLVFAGDEIRSLVIGVDRLVPDGLDEAAALAEVGDRWRRVIKVLDESNDSFVASTGNLKAFARAFNAQGVDMPQFRTLLRSESEERRDAAMHMALRLSGDDGDVAYAGVNRYPELDRFFSSEVISGVERKYRDEIMDGSVVDLFNGLAETIHVRGAQEHVMALSKLIEQGRHLNPTHFGRFYESSKVGTWWSLRRKESAENRLLGVGFKIKLDKNVSSSDATDFDGLALVNGKMRVLEVKATRGNPGEFSIESHFQGISTTINPEDLVSGGGINPDALKQLRNHYIVSMLPLMTDKAATGRYTVRQQQMSRVLFKPQKVHGLKEQANVIADDEVRGWVSQIREIEFLHPGDTPLDHTIKNILQSDSRIRDEYLEYGFTILRNGAE